MRILPLMTIVALCLTCNAMAADVAEKEAETMVYRHTLSPEQEIRVYASSPIDSHQLGAMSVQFSDGQELKTVVRRVELFISGRPGITLGTWLTFQGEKEYSRTFDVLDVLAEPGKLSIITAEGGLVQVRQFRIGYPNIQVCLLGWEVLAAAMPRDRSNTEGKLSRSPDGQLVAEVRDGVQSAELVTFRIQEPQDSSLRADWPRTKRAPER